MIIEEPVIRFLEIEVETPAEGFRLGIDRLGTGELGASAPPVWEPYLCDALNVEAVRGGKRSGVVATMDVGTLNVRFKDAADPTTNPVIVPNRAVRLFAKGASRPMFTGTISDVDMAHVMDKRTGKITTYVNLVVVDAVQSHANLTRYGAIAPGGFERWEERIQRLARSAVAPIDLPLAADPIVRYSLA